MMRWFVLLGLFGAQAMGQLALYVVEGTTETALAPNSLFQLKPIESGDTQSIRLRVRNHGPQDAQVTQFVADGVGFMLQRPLPPLALRPGDFVNATLVFTAGAPANYSANLRMNGTNVLLLATVSAGPTLTISENCRGATDHTIDFGFVPSGEPRRCEATLSNETDVPRTISTLSATGPGFSLAPVAMPVVLAPGQSIGISVQLTAQASGKISGALQVQARLYVLAAVGVDPPLPKPVITYGPTAFGSGQQRKLTVKLEGPAPVSAAGTLNLAFQPAFALAADDPAILFLENGSRQVRFSVRQGETEVKLADRDSVTLQTGTTAGTLRFTFSGYGPGFTSDPTFVMNIHAAPVALDRVLVARFPGRIDVQLLGHDNTFSMGAMTFRFYDATGKQIGPAIPADFSGAFRAFYQNSPGGSGFKVTITFPAANSGAVSGFEADLSNAAGTMRTVRIAF